MRVTDVKGAWVGLGYWYDHYVDWFSTPDGWKIGFDIVYRLVFFSDDSRLLDKFMTAFKKSFGLPDAHYDLERPSGTNSVFWRVYWDRGPFYIRSLQKCEDRLGKLAEAAQTRVILVRVVIIPRSLDHIHELVESNDPAKGRTESSSSGDLPLLPEEAESDLAAKLALQKFKEKKRPTDKLAKKRLSITAAGVMMYVVEGLTSFDTPKKVLEFFGAPIKDVPCRAIIRWALHNPELAQQVECWSKDGDIGSLASVVAKLDGLEAKRND